MDEVSILSLAVGVLGFLFAVFVAIRSKQVHTATIEFKAGTTNVRKKEMPKKYRKHKISSIVYGAKLSEKDQGYFLFPLTLENTSKLPVKNIRVTLSYPARFCLSDSEIKKSLGEQYQLNKNPIEREIHVFSDWVSVIMRIPLLRPGENLAFGDAFKVSTPSSKVCNPENEGALANAMYAIEKLGAFFTVDISIVSENCQPISYRTNVAWLNTSELEEVQSHIVDINRVYWGGRFPKAGVYFVPIPWKRIYKKECAEIIFPDLVKTSQRNGQNIYIEKPFESTGALAEMQMPTWNYYQEERRNVEFYYDPWATKLFEALRRLKRRLRGKVEE